jgi:hypothetical protein
VDEVTPAKPVTTQDPSVARGRPDHNGLTPHVAAVEAARDRLGRDLDLLNTEVRAQMGQTAEKTAWKLAALGSGVVAGIAVRKVLMSGWKATHHGNLPPTNPANRQTQWSEALMWTLATSIGVGIARLVATRGAAGLWEKATGALPPGLEEVSA